MAEKSVNELPRELRLLFTKGNDALARENYDYAIDLFGQVLLKEPSVFDCRKALRNAQFRKAGKGAGLFKKMLNTAASQPMVGKGQMALRKNPAEALQIAEQILNGDPTNSGAHRLVVEAATAMEMPRTAVLSLEVLARNSPKDREVAIKFANALADSGEVVRAEKILSELYEEFPTDNDLAQALKNISARRTMDKGGYEALADGKGSYRDILKNEDEAKALEQEHRQVKTEDNVQRMIDEKEVRLKTDPNNIKALRDLAELYTQKQQFDRALSYYERIKGTEGGVDSSLDRGMADTMSRKFDFEISQLDPAAPDYAEKSAKLQADKQAYQLAECQKRVERFPTDLQIRFEMGKLYFQNGKIGEAIQEFQKAQANANRRVQSLNYLGQCFARRNMNDLAIRTFESAIKDKPALDEEKKELIYNLACVLEKTGKREEATKQFEQIYAVDIGFKDVAAKVDAYYAGQS
jgi:tetratricopeptide (TPR) repeat protein